MGILIAANEFVLLVFGCWTLAYHFCLIARVASGKTYMPFLVALTVLLPCFLPKWRRLLLEVISQRRFLLTVFLLGLAAGSFTLFSCRPDADDVSFFHRAVLQVQMLEKPFFVHHTMLNLPGLPPISMLHLATSYEVFVAFSASLIDVDPVWFYQNGGAFLAAALLVTVYVALYMELGLGRRESVICTIVLLVFLLIDGNVHRSFGNVSLVRLWQGKAILWTVGIPMCVLFAHRLFLFPSLRRFLTLSLLCICGVGLSNSAVFMLPILLIAVSSACLVVYGSGKSHFVRWAAVNAAGWYCGLLALTLLSGILPLPDMAAWQWHQTFWVDNLYLVVGDHWTLARDLFALVVLPLVSLSARRTRGFVVLLSATLCLIATNPLTGPLWVDVLTAGAYWRLVYLFPLPMCVGLTGVLLVSGRSRWKTKSVRLATALVFLVLVSVAFDKPSVRMSQLKWPSGYKFLQGPLTFSESVAHSLDGARLLAPPEIVHVLPLLNPTIRMESVRPAETLHIFRNAHMLPEGERRVLSQQLVSGISRSPRAVSAFLQSVARGVDAIVVRDSALTEISKLLASTAVAWRRTTRACGYTLLLKTGVKKRLPETNEAAAVGLTSSPRRGMR